MGIRDMMRGWIIGVVVVLVPGAVASQSGMITGSVSSREGGPVVAALVEAVPDWGGNVRVAQTDSSGLFGLPGLRPGRYRVEVMHLGYAARDTVVDVVVSGVVRLEFTLPVRALAFDAIVVEARRSRARFEETAGATVRDLAGDEVKGLPGLAEADVLRAVEVLPGVVSTSDFSAAFNVRGGAADQNLILLDGFPVYNPFHLGGIFGVFNSDMVRRAELLAGGFPARYGGRVSSVLTVESDAGVGDSAPIHGGVSLLAARAAASVRVPGGLLEPVGLERGRVRVSGRRSYFDQVLRPLFDFPYHLTDLQFVAEAWNGEDGRLTLTGYTGADVLRLTGSTDGFPLELDMEWGNDVLGARWRQGLGEARLDLRLGHSGFGTSIVFPEIADTEFRSGIEHGLGGVDVAVPMGRGLTLAFGGELARLGYDNLAKSGGTVFRARKDEGWQSAGYVQGRWALPERWLLEVGGRVDAWDPTSTDAMVMVSPRLALKRFVADGAAAVKLAAGRYTQFVHSLRDEEFPIGIDTWVTAGAEIPAVVSDQAQVGLEWFASDRWYLSLESYARTFDGVITMNFADDPNDRSDDLLAGEGVSYGADLLVRRDAAPDDWSGWVTVSWLKATRSFPDRSAGLVPAPVVTYPPIYDRRLDLELVLRRRLGPVEAGLRWNYGSGLPYTRPLGVYTLFDYQASQGTLEPERDDEDESEVAAAVVLGSRNGARYPAYHRLDVSFRRSFDTAWGTVTPFLDILNLYNRENVLFYFFEYDVPQPVRTGVSMLPFVPTLGAEVTF